MFQNFDAPAEQVIGNSRLDALRDQMAKHGVDALLIPHADEYRNEYLPEAHERLAWISGFTGSAGEAVVTGSEAVLFVDGRYTLQAADQTDARHWSVESLTDNPAHKWLAAQMPSGSTIGYDPNLHTKNEVEKLEKAAEKIGGNLRALDENLVDAIWSGRPALPTGAVFIHDYKLAGRLTAEKLQDVQAKMAERNANICLLSDPASVCWLFNIRGSDVAHTPIVLAHAIIQSDSDPLLYIAPEKLDIEVKAFLTQVCDLRDPADLQADFRKLAAGSSVMLDPDLTPSIFGGVVEQAGGTVVSEPDPVKILRATKNDAEIAGTKAAHLRDGAAMCTFLAWLNDQQPGTLGEIEAAKKLEDTRREMAGDVPLRDISFDTISGSGPHGAIVHYRVTEATDRTLQAGELYLSDSGGQYEDGTTDITRTVAIGEPSSDQRRAFTLVLKGHIGIALARFPKGTRGVDLDVLARIALWRHGMDYGHGTGHGVGSYLSVHEGPQNISRRGMAELLPGMIVSNEPGYYREGEFGIRIENLVLVTEPKDIPGGDKPMMGFETLTLCPIDNRLIDPTMMDDDELHWLNAYHGWVRRKLEPLVSEDIAKWLRRATEPLTRDLPPASA